MSYELQSRTKFFGGKTRMLIAIFIFFLYLFACIAMMNSKDDSFFQDQTGISGINFRLENFPTREKYLIETMTGGCAFLDYDGDGLVDVFLVNGAAIKTESGRPRIDKSEPQ